MRKQVVNALSKFGLLVAIAMTVAAGSAQAQTLANRINANIPFDFIVSDQKLPAGEYSISRGLPNSGDTIMQVSSVAGHARATRLTIPVVTQLPKNHATLVFHRYGNQYFLFQVWAPGSSVGRALPKSHAEREVQHKAGDAVGKIAQPMDTVTVSGRE